MINDLPRLDLTPSYSISQILKGGWQLSEGHSQMMDVQQAIEDMRTFVEAGITTFDCADIYTGVEELIGKFLKKYKHTIDSGELPAVQVHTKCVPDLDELPIFTKAKTEALVDRSLKRIGVERLDLVQFFWWDLSIPGYLDLAQHLAELQKAGKIRYIGVTNFDAAHLKEILDEGVQVVSNQVQYSVLDQRPEEDISELCRQHDIKLLCYGTLAGGFLTESYLGVIEPHEPLKNRSLTKYKLIIDEFGGWDLFQELMVCLKTVADKYKVGIAEVAIKYVLQKQLVAGAIVGAHNSKHIKKIMLLKTFELDKQDLKDINDVISKSKGPKGNVYEIERQKDGKHAKIMRYNQNKLVMADKNAVGN
jgi:aryl-alcohol dehydrogenase-like predicted oxidoreductase